MKKAALIIAGLIASISAVGSGKGIRVIENPDYDVTAQKVITITSIELSDTATRLNMHARYRPNFWIQIDSTSRITDPASGISYNPVRGEGIRLGDRFRFPDTGEADFSVVYPPLPQGVKCVDFDSDDNKIFGLRLDGKEATCKHTVSKTEWEKENAKPYPGAPDEFLRKGNCNFSGHINGYDPRLKISNFLIYVNNPITGESFPKYVEIGDDGTFNAVIPLQCPGVHTVLLGNGAYFDVYLEPEQDIRLFIEYEDILNCALDRYCGKNTSLNIAAYGGSLADINREYAAAPRPEPSYIGDMYKTTAPDEAIKTIREWGNRHCEATDDYISSNSLNPVTQKLLDARMKSYAPSLVNEYAMYHKNMSLFAKDSDPSIAEAAMLPKHYEDIRTMLRDDNPWLLTDTGIITMLNRLAFFPLLEDSGVESSTSANTDSNDKLVRDAQYIRLFAGTDEIPWLWQVVISAYTSNWSINLADRLTQEEAYAKLRKLENYGLVTDSRILAKMKEHIDRQYETFELPDDDRGRIIKEIIAPFKGKYLLLDFWSTGCGPCRANIEQSAAMRAANREHPDFKIIFITGDEESPEYQYDKYVKKHLAEETTLRIPQTDFNRLRDLFKFNGIPHYVLIDREGRVADINIFFQLLSDILSKNYGIKLQQ